MLVDLKRLDFTVKLTQSILEDKSVIILERRHRHITLLTGDLPQVDPCRLRDSVLFLQFILVITIGSGFFLARREISRRLG